MRITQIISVLLLTISVSSVFFLQVTLISGWQTVQTLVLVELNISTSVNGAQCVMHAGIWELPVSSVDSWIVGLLCLLWDQTGLEREVVKSGLMCLIVTGMKQNSQNVPSLHGVELNVLTDEMLESSALVSTFTPHWSHGFQNKTTHFNKCSIF